MQLRRQQQLSQSWRHRENVIKQLMFLLVWLALIDSWLVFTVDAGMIVKRETDADDPDIVSLTAGAKNVPTKTAITTTTALTTTTIASQAFIPIPATATTAVISNTTKLEATKWAALESGSVKFLNESEKLSTEANDSRDAEKLEASLPLKRVDKSQTNYDQDGVEQQVTSISAVPAKAVHAAIVLTTAAVPITTTTSIPKNILITESTLAAIKHLQIIKVSDSDDDDDDVAASNSANGTSATPELVTTTTLPQLVRSADFARVMQAQEEEEEKQDAKSSTRAAMMLHALIMSTTARNAQPNALTVQQEEVDRDEQSNQLEPTVGAMLSLATATTTSLPPMTASYKAKHSLKNTIDVAHGNDDDGNDEEESRPEKRPKFIKDNSTNAQQMNLPNRIEVWSLAAMKLVPKSKTTNASELGNDIEEQAKSEYAPTLAVNKQFEQLKTAEQHSNEAAHNATLLAAVEAAITTEAMSVSVQLNEIKDELQSTANLAKANASNEPLALQNMLQFVEKQTNTNEGSLSTDKKDNDDVVTMAAATITATPTTYNNKNAKNEQLSLLKITSVTQSSTPTPKPMAAATATAVIANKVPQQNQIQLEDNEQRTETNFYKQKTAVPAAAAAAATTVSPLLKLTELSTQAAAGNINTTLLTALFVGATDNRAMQVNEKSFASADSAATQARKSNSQRTVDNGAADANAEADAAVTNETNNELASAGSTTATRVSSLTTSKASATNEESVTTLTTTTAKTITAPTLIASDSKFLNKRKPDDLATSPITVGTTTSTTTTTTEAVQISKKVNLEAQLKTKTLQYIHTNEANTHVDDDDDVGNDDDGNEDGGDDETLKNEVKLPNDLINITKTRTNGTEEVQTTKVISTTATTKNGITEATVASIGSTQLIETATVADVAKKTHATAANVTKDVRIVGQQKPTNTEVKQQESSLGKNNISETLERQQQQQQEQQHQVIASTPATITKETATVAAITTIIPITIQINETKLNTETETNVSKNVEEAHLNNLPETDGDNSGSVYDEDDDMQLLKITTTPTTNTNMETRLINQNITTTTAPVINLLDDSTTTTTTPKSIATKIEDIYKIISTTTTATTRTVTELEIDTDTEAVAMLPKESTSTTSSGSGTVSSTTEVPTLQWSTIGGAHNSPTAMDMDNLQTKSTNTESGTDVNVIIAITVSVIGVVALILLVAFLYLMRKREKQKCRPVPNLDAYSLDNVSILGGSVRRKNILRVSKRSYGNAAFDDPALRHNVLSAAELVKFVERKSSIFEEFRDVPQIIARTNEVPIGCEDRNRYANVIPLPETRVMLQQFNGDDKTEYINANYVRGPKDAPNYYIACQAPLNSTVCDFWRMIWEQESRVIIQATDLTENGIEKCAEYLPPSVTLDNHTTYGDFQVTLKNREVKDKYAISTLLLKHTVEKTSRELTHYWYKWPEAGVPSEEAQIIAMLLEARSSLKSYAIEQTNELKEKSSTLTLKSLGNDSSASEGAQPMVHCLTSSTASQKEAETNGNLTREKLKAAARSQGPLTIHCSPGTGRTGTIIACDMAVRSLETPKRSVDIPQIVYYVRRGRASAVQTKEQYEFIYKVANMYATKITNLSNDN